METSLAVTQATTADLSDTFRASDKAAVLQFLSQLLLLQPAPLQLADGTGRAIAGFNQFSMTGEHVGSPTTFAHHTGPVKDLGIYPNGLYSAFDYMTDFSLLLRRVYPPLYDWQKRKAYVSQLCPTQDLSDFQRELTAVVTPPGVRSKFVRNWALWGPTMMMVPSTPEAPGMHLGGVLPIKDSNGTNMGHMLNAILTNRPVDADARSRTHPFTLAFPSSLAFNAEDLSYYRYGRDFCAAYDFVPDYNALPAILSIPVDYLLRCRWQDGQIYLTWAAIASVYHYTTSLVFQTFDSVESELNGCGVANRLVRGPLVDVLRARIPGGPLLSMPLKEHSIPTEYPVETFNSLVESTGEPLFPFPGALPSDKRDIYLGKTSDGMVVMSPGDKPTTRVFVGVMGSGKTSKALLYHRQKGPFIWVNCSSGINTKRAISAVNKQHGKIFAIGSADYPLVDAANETSEAALLEKLPKGAEALFHKILSHWHEQGMITPIVVYPERESVAYFRLIKELLILFKDRYEEWHHMFNGSEHEHLLSFIFDDVGVIPNRASESLGRIPVIVGESLKNLFSMLGKEARGRGLDISYIFHTTAETTAFAEGFAQSADLVFFLAADKSHEVKVYIPATGEADITAWNLIGSYSGWLPASLLVHL